MTRDRDDLRPEDVRALEELVRAREGIAASDLARRRTREAFLRSGPPQSRPWRARLFAAAAILAVGLTLAWYGARPAEPWRIVGVTGPAEVWREGRLVDLEAGVEFAAGMIAVGDSTEVELEWGRLHLRLRPGTRVRIPDPPGRWFGRDRVLALETGEAYGSSGGAGPGFALRLRTAEAEARLLGTTFAVFRYDRRTCFCLFRGGLEVTPHGQQGFRLPVGHRVYVFADGPEPSVEPLDAGETMKLQMVDDAASAPCSARPVTGPGVDAYSGRSSPLSTSTRNSRRTP